MIGDIHDRMTIPDRFVQSFRRETGKTINLESHNGSTYGVQVTRNSEKLIFQSGWKAFVSAHDLKMGDFLVFRYDGNSHLKVLIFDPSGCQKVIVMKNSTICGERAQEPTEIASTCSDLPVRYPPRGRQTRAQWDSSRQGNKIIHVISSSRSTTSGSKGYNSPCQSISSSRITPSGSAGDASASDDDSEADFASSCILAQGTYLTRVQKKKLREKIRAIGSEIPIYGYARRKSNIYGKSFSIVISRKYAEVYLPFVERERMLTLQRQGKRWEVRYRVEGGRSKRLKKGWIKFARDNSLQLGDICLFELLKNKNKYVMKVHIIRKAEI